MMPIIGNQLRKRDPRQLIFIGLFLLWLAVLGMAGFDSDTSVAGLFWPLLIRGAAMAYIFVPINSTVLSQFSGREIGEAAGLLNLSRQLGGSLGIAGFSTLFAKFQDQHFGDLLRHVTWFDPAATSAYYSIVNMMHSAKMQAGVGMATAQHAAVQLLFYRTKKQAFVLAFQHVLKIAATLFSLSLIPLVMLKVPKKTGKQEVIIDAH